MEKTIHIFDDQSKAQSRANLAYWRSKPERERILAIERLRRHEHGSLQRLRRVVRITQQAEG